MKFKIELSPKDLYALSEISKDNKIQTEKSNAESDITYITLKTMINAINESVNKNLKGR